MSALAAETPWYAALPASGAAPSPRWRSEEFRQELRSWVEGAVAPVSGMEQVHLRPWSTVWRVETGEGLFFAKENCPLQSFEAELMAALARLAPDHVVPVTAIEAGRGLLLTPDQGAVLGEKISNDDLAAWSRVVVAAMELQRQVSHHTDELVDAGLVRLPASEAAAYVEARTASLAALPDSDQRRLTPESVGPLRAVLPELKRWADQVGSLGLPDSLVHNDLHAYNVFDSPAGLRFFDFGDSLLMQPLTALLIPLNVLAHRLEAQPGDPRLWTVAEAALEVWSDVAPMSSLRAALPAALQLGRIGRVESWLRVTTTMTSEELDEYGDAPAAWLDTLRLEPPTGWGEGRS